MTSEAISETSVEEYRTPIPRPLLIGAGGVVLMAIMLIGAFSLGVWWANGRETTPATFGFNGPPPPGGGGPVPGAAQGQQNQNFGPFGGQQAQQGAQIAPGPQNLAPPLTGAAVDKLPRSPDVVGTFTALDRGVLTIATRNGTRFVTVTANTSIYLPDGSQGTLQSLVRGSGVAIVTQPSPDGRSLDAQVIAMLPPN